MIILRYLPYETPQGKKIPVIGKVINLNGIPSMAMAIENEDENDAELLINDYELTQ